MKKLISLAGLIALGTAGLGGLGPVAEAGDAPAPAPPPADFVVVYEASGDAAEEIIDAITPQLFETDGTTEVTGCTAIETDAGASLQYTCPDLPTGFPTGIDYVVGIEGVPLDGRVDGVSCADSSPGLDIRGGDALSLESEFPDARRAHGPSGSICTVFLDTNPTIGIDVEIVGGAATVADFSFDILDESEVTIATGVVDPAAGGCPGLGSNDANCSSTRAPIGTYSIAPNTVPASYLPTGFACDGDPATNGTEPGTFAHSTDDRTDTRCVVTYTYATQLLAVDVVVVNDDGGTAVAGDFIIEVRDATDTVVATGTDPEPGTGNASAEFTLPLGDYTITVTGPAGYTTTVETTVVERSADLAVTDLFSLTATQTVTGVVTANDPTPAPTTTTTTTTTTTLLPTGLLPATGSTDSNLWLAVLAAGFVLLGAGTVLATRRR